MQAKTEPKSWLQRQALLHPERPAFLWKKESWSFSLLAQVAQRYAHYYAANLPATSKRVAIYSKNSPAMYLTILGLWELGMEVQLLNRRLTVEEWRFQLNDAQTEWLLCDDVRAIPDTIACLAIPDLLEKDIAQADYIDAGYESSAIASIMYTSGTTGQPKGVPQTFGNHHASIVATQHSLQLTGDDCWGLVLPLFHISGLSILLRSLKIGLAVRLYEQFDPVVLNASLQAGEVTVLSLVTSTLQALLPVAPSRGYAHLKAILLGGGPIMPSLIEEAMACKIPIMPSFGMTETCSQITALPVKELTHKVGSAGYPLNDVKVKIVPSTNQMNATALIGEIFVKGPSIVTGYLNQRSEDSWTEDGWLKTGDLGYLDQDGALYLKSRLSELIISGGENIYPSEIEQILMRHPAITAAAVIGQMDEQWGQVPIAFIQLTTANALTRAALQPYLTASLATYKHPKMIYVVHSFPKTASGKVLKRLFLTEERVKYIEYPLST